MITQQAARYGDKVCMYFDDVAVTYKEMNERSNSVANWLHANGIGLGDRVVIFMTNAPEFMYMWFGAAKLGAVTVPINTAYSGDFLSHQVRSCGARLAITEPELAHRLYAVASDCPDLARVLVRPVDDTPIPIWHALECGSTDELLTTDGSKLAFTPAVTIEMPIAIYFTSGTTGLSKGAVITHCYVDTVAEIIAKSRKSTDKEIAYGPVPLFHFSGMLGLSLAVIRVGGTVVLDTWFSLSNTWDRIRKYQATSAILVGPMLTLLWNLPPDPSDADLPIKVLGSAPIPPELWHAIEERYGVKLVTMYGMTEAFPLALKAVDDAVAPGSSGRANPSFDVRLFDDNDCEVPVGETGEIVCRPRMRQVMFEGYDNNPAATLSQMRNLWFHTGDLGRFDADGNLFFIDRKKDAIRRRGENISSFEVEHSILQHPDVADIAVHAVSSELGEDDVKACVVLVPGASLGHVELMDFCKTRLPFFAMPRYIEFVTELPRNHSGRVLKFQLRERSINDDTWDREAAGYIIKSR